MIADKGVDTAGLVQGFKDKKIARIASGNQHSLAIDEDGYVYSWGYNGYCRLGLQDQKDRYVAVLLLDLMMLMSPVWFQR